MENLTKYHLNRIASLSRHALKVVEAAQVPPTKGEKPVPLNYELLTMDLLLIRENVRMVKKVENIETAGDELDAADEEDAARVA